MYALYVDTFNAATLPLLTKNYTLLSLVNPSHTTGLFLYTLKTSENQWLTVVFRSYRKRLVI